MAKKIRVWDGTQWQDVAPSLPYTAIHSAQASMPLTGVDGQVWLDTDGTLAGQDFVPLSGGTMTGNLNVPSINSGPIVGRNKILNGDFSIWQRGTSFSNNPFYTADRWWAVNATGTIGRSADAPTGFAYSLHNSSGTTYNFGQPIELIANGVPIFTPGSSVTLSFFAKSDTPTTTSPILYYRNSKFDNTNQSSFSGSGVAISIGTTWQRYSITYTASAANSSNAILAFESSLPVGMKITGIQLEAGNQATPFHTATPNQQTELAACQRYYYRLGGDQTYQLLSYGPAHSTTRAYIPIRFPVTMRTIPSSIDWSTLALQRDPSQSIYSVTSLANLNNNGSGRDVFGLDVTIGSASLSAGTAYILMTNGSTSAYLGFSAEL